MRIHCICVVRDEIDIIRHTLDAALRWADAIYVLDNGSTDGTWEFLQSYVQCFPQVVLAGRTYETYRNSMVADVANKFLNNAKKGDWWCRLDADEIYAENPREFLSRISKRYQIVYAIVVNHYFTDVDLALYERDPLAYIEHWKPEQLRFYMTNYSEPRFVRHLPGVEWTDRWPSGFWYLRPAPARILMRNYDYRFPAQIEHRIYIRTNCTETDSFPHEKKSVWAPVGLEVKDVVFPGQMEAERDLWRTRVVRSSALLEDDGEQPLRINWDLVTPIWMPLPRHMQVARRIKRYFLGLIPSLSNAQS